MNAYKKACPNCHSSSVTAFLKRDRVPVHQNLVVNEQKFAVEIIRGDLDLLVCEECGFIFNEAFEPSKLSYDKSYDNTQTYSPSFNEYVENLAHYLIFEKAVQNCQIVEVGCGKGLFLRKLVEVDEAGNIGYGFDPSYVGPETDFEGRLKFEKRYYDANCADIPADVVVCRHVIEHVPEPVNLLRTIGQALVNSPHARVFFETPCVEWILQNQVFWDFFYEHCSYFTANSMTTAFEASGFRVESVHHVFGGQYLWLEATLADENLAVTKQPGSIGHLAKQFVASEAELKKFWLERLRELTLKGKVAIWGAGAKGVTFANSIDPECRWITCVVDLNPQKQGHYLPGTGHPIVSPQELVDYQVKVAILMNPNYRDENLALLDELNIDIDLVE